MGFVIESYVHMRLLVSLVCFISVLWIGCGGSKSQAKITEISPELLVFDSEGKAKHRDTGKVFSGLMVKRNTEGKIISSFTFKDGRRNGPSSEFYQNGAVKTEAKFKNDKLHGNFGEWFINGQKKIEGRFDNGLPIGVFREWGEDGKQEWELTATNGQLGDRKIIRNEDLKLSETDRKYLWDTEHHSTLMRKYGFVHAKEALLTHDEKALKAILAEDFIAWVPDSGFSVARDLGTASASRLEVNPEDLKQVGRDVFKNWLLKELSEISGKLNVKLHLITFAPSSRDTIKGVWKARVKLRAWAKGATGSREELILYMDWKLDFPDKHSLKAGAWLHECRITRRKRASANKPLMKNVATEIGLPVTQLHDNWKHGPDKTDTNTGGVFACDYNRDGITDLLVTDKVPSPKGASMRHYFFRGTKDGRMLNVTDEVGLGNTRIDLACFADIDGDGWVDMVTGMGHIYQNQKGQRFLKVDTNLIEASDMLSDGSGSGITVADYDRDGRLDLYIFRNDVNRLEGTWVDGKIGPGAANKLLRNLGGWRFENVTSVTDTDGGRRSTFTSVWLDANNDNWPDLYVINEYGNGVLLTNQGGNKRFKKTELMDRAADFGSMGLTAGDFNNDGNIDLYVASMYSKSGSRVIGNLRPDAYDATTMLKLQRMVAGSQLYSNLGDAKFKPVGKQFDVVAVGWAYGPTLVDFDNDGFLDIHATTGFISRTRDKPDG